jgi:hypothetical protein
VLAGEAVANLSEAATEFVEADAIHLEQPSAALVGETQKHGRLTLSEQHSEDAEDPNTGNSHTISGQFGIR